MIAHVDAAYQRRGLTGGLLAHNLGLPNSNAFSRSKLNRIQYIRFRSRRSHTGSVQFVGSICKPSKFAVPTA